MLYRQRPKGEYGEALEAIQFVYLYTVLPSTGSVIGDFDRKPLHTEVTYSIHHSGVVRIYYTSAPSSLLRDKIILNLNTAAPRSSSILLKARESFLQEAPHNIDFRFSTPHSSSFEEGMARQWLLLPSLEDEDVSLVRGQDL
jgi:hypothetical protein